MKYLIFLLVSVLLGCCGTQPNDKSASISGEIESLKKDTIYFYGSDQFYPQVDTIIVRRGKFNARLAIDTLTSGYLYIQSLNKELPVFINKNENIHLLSKNPDNLNDLQVTGNEYNQELYQFLSTIYEEDADVQNTRVKEFIQSHPYSYADLYLIDHYMLQKEKPDYLEMDSLISNLSGLLRDTPYITQLTSYIKRQKEVAIGRPFPTFNLPSSLGKNITRMNTFRDKILLVHFWASWNPESRVKNKELKEFYERFKSNKNFDMLGISFDTDTNLWEGAIKEDSLNWIQAHLYEGFNRKSEQAYGVNTLPCIYLLNRSGKIQLRTNNLTQISDTLRTMLKKIKEY